MAFEQNIQGVGQRDMVYDQDNKPVEITYNGQTSHLSYDGEGNRIKKTGGGRTTIYVGGLYEISGGQAVVHIFAAGKRIASIKAGHKYYTHGDHLGSTSLVTDDNGLRVEEIGYLPFGATLFRKAYNNGAWTSVYRFTGQEFDAEYALYNYNARLYDPVLARFITADTMVPDWTDPQSLNRYAYCRNNPLKYVDPSGHFWGAFFIGLLKAIGIGAAIGAAVGGIMAAMNGGDIWQGITQGAISGAISGAFFYCAGEVIGHYNVLDSAGVVIDNQLNAVQQGGIHAVAGASSGAVNAAITGGDVGREALVGGLSAGIANGLGGGLEARMAVGMVAGGVSSVLSGGDFGQGAIQGAWTSVIAFICNHGLHDNETHFEKLQREYTLRKEPNYAKAEASRKAFLEIISPDWEGAARIAQLQIDPNDIILLERGINIIGWGLTLSEAGVLMYAAPEAYAVFMTFAGTPVGQNLMYQFAPAILPGPFDPNWWAFTGSAVGAAFHSESWLK